MFVDVEREERNVEIKMIMCIIGLKSRLGVGVGESGTPEKSDLLDLYKPWTLLANKKIFVGPWMRYS